MKYNIRKKRETHKVKSIKGNDKEIRVIWKKKKSQIIQN